MSRGKVTDAVTEAANRLLGIDEITTQELRLMPYVQYVMMNEQRLDPNKINAAERKILGRWKEAGWIEGGAGGMAITKEFWDALSEILWLSYVDV